MKIVIIGGVAAGTKAAAKLKRENAITFKYDLLCDYDFEVYGVFDYLTDFYLNGKLNEISLNIKKVKRWKFLFQ